MTVDADMVRVGQYILEKRLAMGWTSEQLAAKTGMTVARIDEHEDGLVDLKIDALATFARVLGVPPQDIFDLLSTDDK